MSGTASEFARPVRIDGIGETPHTLSLEADAAERTALATRFSLLDLPRLEADVTVRRTGEVVHAEGTVRAEVVQACVATGVPLPGTVQVPLVLRFAPEADLAAHEEVELSNEDCDTIGYDGSAIDLGEAVAETFYLAIDPFPRAADADAVLKAAGVVDESEVGPFAALKSLRDKLAK